MKCFCKMYVEVVQKGFFVEFNDFEVLMNFEQYGNVYIYGIRYCPFCGRRLMSKNE